MRTLIALFLAVVGLALVPKGVVDIWLSYQELKTLLVRVQSEQAKSAAEKIGQFVKEIEGQMAWALGDALWQEITVKDGRVVEGNFDEFRITRMADYPIEVNIQFLKTNNKWITGVGEEAIPQIAPAIAQAVFKITGKRIRSLPLGKHDLSWA